MFVHSDQSRNHRRPFQIDHPRAGRRRTGPCRRDLSALNHNGLILNRIGARPIDHARMYERHHRIIHRNERLHTRIEPVLAHPQRRRRQNTNRKLRFHEPDYRTLGMVKPLVPALLAAPLTFAAVVRFDIAAPVPGSIAVTSTTDSALVEWKDKTGRPCTARFSLDPAKPLITAITVNGKIVINRAQPDYRVSTGKRRGGFDQFFDYPPSAPEGTRSFLGSFKLTAAHAKFEGDRLDISFDGLGLGIFQGSIHYFFFPGSILIQQRAIVSTNEPRTAFYYDAGLRMAVDEDRRSGGTMETNVTYYDTSGKLQTVRAPHASERTPVAVRYRALSVPTGAGSVAVFPPPHRYFMARDYTTNMGYLWYSSWRGTVSLGIRQLPDDDAPFYPWMNAPPGTQQELDLFLLIDDRPAPAVLEAVLPYTHRDRFVPIEGYKTFAPHWHFAYTVQAMDHGYDWTPPFKPVLKNMGVNIIMPMDFHGDGHPHRKRAKSASANSKPTLTPPARNPTPTS